MGIYYEDDAVVINSYSPEELNLIKQEHLANLASKRAAAKLKRIDKNRKRNTEYICNRRQQDPIFKLRMNIANLIRKSFKNNIVNKTSRTTSILGCTVDEFRLHIETQFTEGMTWDNYGLWQLDHIIPQSFAITEEDVLKLNHYTNFQPLWKEENRNKSNTYIG